MITLDILIIGGGIQGLWTFNNLTELGYRVALITDSPLGNGQTLDSQVYKHTGHFYNNIEMAQRLKEFSQEWQDFIKASNLVKAQKQAFLGFNRKVAVKWTQMWDQAGLEYSGIDPQEIPQAFKEGELKQGCFFHTGETCLHGQELIKNLAEPVKDLIFQGQITGFQSNHGLVTEVQATIAGKAITFLPKYIVLTAGRGNQHLLNQITKDDVVLHQKTKDIQQLRRCQVLVLKGEKLPSTSCLFPGLQLFSGCREVNGEIIWLVTYGFDDPIELDINSKIPVDKKRLQLCIKQLQKVMPKIMEMDLDWALYPAVKAESKALGSGLRPNGDFVDNCGLQNVTVCYPTKLSLAPRASKRIAHKIQDYLGQGEGRFNPSNFGIPQQEVPIGKERWQTLDWLKWQDFCHTVL